MREVEPGRRHCEHCQRDVQLRVIGHSDDRGTQASQMEISQRRADAVYEFLVNAGVDPQRLEAEGHESFEPIESNATSKGRARNRRVEFSLR